MSYSYDANGSPVSEAITNQHGDHIKAHADIESEDKRSPRDAPRVRQLDVRDDHVVYLLTLVADDLLRTRRLGAPASFTQLEMQAALNVMASAT